MRVAFKLVSVLTASIMVLLAIDAVMTIRRERKLFHDDMQHDARMLGYTLKHVVADTWRSRGEQPALALIDLANRNEQRVHVRWVWLAEGTAPSHRSRVAPQTVLAGLARRPDVAFQQRGALGDEYAYTYVPVDVPESRPGALELTEPLSYLNRYTHTTMVKTFALAAGLLVCGATVSTVLGYRVVAKPLEKLMVKLRRIGSGDLSGPLQMSQKDEFGRLAEALDDMCEQLTTARQKLQAETAARIKTLEDLRHADRLRTVGQLAAGLAHELGTPLNVVSERARIIQEDSRVPEVRDSARIIEEQSDRMADIGWQLMGFARRQASAKSPTDVWKLIGDTVELLRPLAAERQINVCLQPSDATITVPVCKHHIQQVLTNLVVNAMDASPATGVVEIEVERIRTHSPREAPSLSRDYARIDVRDYGCGISEQDVERVFEPFFTTKEVGQGTGLGLSIAHSIVQEHGGWIDVHSRRNSVTCFSVYLPFGDLDPGPDPPV